MENPNESKTFEYIEKSDGKQPLIPYEILIID